MKESGFLPLITSIDSQTRNWQWNLSIASDSRVEELKSDGFLSSMGAEVSIGSFQELAPERLLRFHDLNRSLCAHFY